MTRRSRSSLFALLYVSGLFTVSALAQAPGFGGITLPENGRSAEKIREAEERAALAEKHRQEAEARRQLFVQTRRKLQRGEFDVQSALLRAERFIRFIDERIADTERESARASRDLSLTGDAGKTIAAATFAGIADALRNYNGLGAEAEIAELSRMNESFKTYRSQLERFRDDLTAELNQLVPVNTTMQAIVNGPQRLFYATYWDRSWANTRLEQIHRVNGLINKATAKLQDIRFILVNMKAEGQIN